MEQPERNTERSTDGTVERGLVTDIALTVAATGQAISTGLQVVDAIKSRPAKEPPKEIILPPGTKTDK